MLMISRIIPSRTADNFLLRDRGIRPNLVYRNMARPVSMGVTETWYFPILYVRRNTFELNRIMRMETTLF